MNLPNDSNPKSIANTSKKKVLKSLKNVLATSYTQQWCPIQIEDLNVLHESMEKNLPSLKQLKSRIPWKILRKITKEERRKTLEDKRNKINEKESNQPIKFKRSFLSLGLNETSKCLNKNQLSCVIIDGENRSKRVGVFLVNLALSRNTPVVVCPRLLEITLEKFGFKCLAFGIKQNMPSESNLKSLINLQNKVLEIFSKQSSLEPILCDKFKQIIAEVQTELELETKSNAPCNILDKKNVQKMIEISDDEPTISDQNYEKCDTTTEENDKKNEQVIVADSTTSTIFNLSGQFTASPKQVKVHSDQLQLNNIYKYRTNKTYRVFIPTNSNVEQKKSTDSKISEEFMSIDNTNDNMYNKQVKGKRKNQETTVDNDLFCIDTFGMVKPPVIKKIKPNPKRVKKK